MTDVCCDLDIPLDSVSHDNQFVDNVLIYISGFIMRKLIEKENCPSCDTIHFSHSANNESAAG